MRRGVEVKLTTWRTLSQRQKSQIRPSFEDKPLCRHLRPPWQITPTTMYKRKKTLTSANSLKWCFRHISVVYCWSIKCWLPLHVSFHLTPFDSTQHHIKVSPLTFPSPFTSARSSPLLFRPYLGNPSNHPLYTGCTNEKYPYMYNLLLITRQRFKLIL